MMSIFDKLKNDLLLFKKYIEYILNKKKQKLVVNSEKEILYNKLILAVFNLEDNF